MYYTFTPLLQSSSTQLCREHFSQNNALRRLEKSVFPASLSPLPEIVLCGIEQSQTLELRTLLPSSHQLVFKLYKQTGMDPIERLRLLAPGTGVREGGEKTQPFNRFPSHRVTLVIGYCDYLPVTRISACDTILPIQNLAKKDILLLQGYRLLTKYHLMTIFGPGPEVVTTSKNQCSKIF